MAYPMPDWVFRDTLTIFATHNKRDAAYGVDLKFTTEGIEIRANVAKPSVAEGIIGQRISNIIRATFTTPTNPILVDPDGKSRTLRKDDVLLWSGDGERWQSVGPLVPRVDDDGVPVHYWGTMERVT